MSDIRIKSTNVDDLKNWFADRNCSYTTAITCAIHNENIPAVEYFISQCGNARIPVIETFLANHVRMIDYFREKKLLLNQGRFDHYVVDSMIEKNCGYALKVFLDEVYPYTKIADYSIFNKTGIGKIDISYLFVEACKYNAIDCARVLLEKNARRRKEGLVQAFIRGYLEIVELCVEKGTLIPSDILETYNSKISKLQRYSELLALCFQHRIPLGSVQKDVVNYIEHQNNERLCRLYLQNGYPQPTDKYCFFWSYETFNKCAKELENSDSEHPIDATEEQLM